MKGPFDDIGEKDFTDVELSLHVLCTSDDTQDVTSNDFILDHQHPEVYPVGDAPRKHIIPCSRAYPTICQCRLFLMPHASNSGWNKVTNRSCYSAFHLAMQDIATAACRVKTQRGQSSLSK